jgi:phosphate transport system substrate-binding protein
MSVTSCFSDEVKIKAHSKKGDQMLKKVIGVLAAATLISTAVAGPAQASETINAGGASYTFALQQVCTQAYTEHKVTYNSVGSGAGKTNFRNGTYDFGGSDSLYSASEAKPRSFIYVPLLGGPITIAFNLPGVTRVNLTPKIIGDIYLGKITKWNDPAITKINRTAKLPDLKIVPAYRSDNSGTSNNFTNWLRVKYGAPFKQNDSFATGVGTGLVKGSLSGRGNSGVATTIKSTAGAMGYIDLADANKEGLNYAHVQNASGQFIKPTVANSKLFLEKQNLKATGEIVFDYNARIRGAYDLTLASYGLAPTANGTAKAKAVAAYLKFFVNTCSQQNAAAQGYVALSGTMLRKANEQIAKIK